MMDYYSSSSPPRPSSFYDKVPNKAMAKEPYKNAVLNRFRHYQHSCLAPSPTPGYNNFKWKMKTTPPSNLNDEKMAGFNLRWGGGGYSSFYFVQDCRSQVCLLRMSSTNSSFVTLGAWRLASSTYLSCITQRGWQGSIHSLKWRKRCLTSCCNL